MQDKGGHPRPHCQRGRWVPTADVGARAGTQRKGTSHGRTEGHSSAGLLVGG